MYWGMRDGANGPYVENIPDHWVDNRVLYCPNEIVFWAELCTGPVLTLSKEEVQELINDTLKAGLRTPAYWQRAIGMPEPAKDAVGMTDKDWREFDEEFNGG